MAATVRLQLRRDDALRAVRQLGQRAPNAIARAMNRAVVSARTQIVRDMAKDLGLKQADVKSQVLTFEARPDKLTASIETSGKRIPLVKFGARGPEPSRGKGRGVTAKLPPPGAGRYPRAFLATMRSGHRGVFERVGKARLPIRELQGPSLPHVFNKYKPAALARGEEQLVKNLTHELRFALQQAAQGT